jgi:hypothetical protein
LLAHIEELVKGNCMTIILYIIGDHVVYMIEWYQREYGKSQKSRHEYNMYFNTKVSYTR